MNRVAVIGAGAAGLIALRHLLAQPRQFQVVAYEQTGRIGGTWVYTDQKGIDEYNQPIHSSMYKNLITNIPKESMAIPDFPFDDTLPSFMSHYKVHAYLEQYAIHHQLHEHIKFHRVVENVYPVQDNSGADIWRVTSHDVTDPLAQSQTEEFDAVFVCNGHFAQPNIPELPGMAEFLGHIDHSRNYRTPDRYRDQTVVILGAKSSGQDIAVDIAKIAKKVIISHGSQRLKSSFPENVYETESITSLRANSVVYSDGQVEEGVDSVLFCTGYKYCYPFLGAKCQHGFDDWRLAPLYKHLVHIDYHSLFFIGVCSINCPFPMFNMQVQFAVACLAKRFELPTKSEMMEWIEEDFERKMSVWGKAKYAHTLSDTQWEYNDGLADDAELKHLLPVIKYIYQHNSKNREINVCDFRQTNYKILDSENYAIL